jgi:HAD superfamily hydrolase (TIGR01450 family)
MPKAIPYRAVLLDLEGTLYDSEGLVPRAAQAVAELRSAGLHVRFLTNTTRLSRAALVEHLVGLGVEARPAELFTAVSAAGAWCRNAGKEKVLALLAPAAIEDLEGLRIVTPAVGMGTSESQARLRSSGSTAAAAPTESRARDHARGVDAVVVGDLGESWTFEILNLAFTHLLEGATLVACQKNRFWKRDGGLALDAGPFVAALEYAAATEAVVVGKPSPLFFRSALAGLELEAREAVMVGDDAETDVAGAIEAGLAGWLVRTGKYREGDESRASPWPECVLGSVAELSAALDPDRRG